jgi:hypothetical protein
MKVPSGIRKSVIGKPLSKKALFDYHVRIWVLPRVLRYTQEKDPKLKSEIIDHTLAELAARFPDLDANTSRRSSMANDSNARTKWKRVSFVN